jgi:GT2 family glycosyltransferase
MYYEETDLSWRARLAGFRCRYAPASVVYHDYRPSQPSFSRLHYTFRNRILLLLKNWGWGSLLLISPALLLAELLAWGQACQAGWVGVRAKLKADFWVITHLKSIYRLHVDVKARRRVPERRILDSLTRQFSPVGEGQVGMARLAIKLSNWLFGLNDRLVRIWLR